MKKILLFLLLLTSINFAQSSSILLLFDDAGSMPITFTGTATGNIVMRGTGVIVVDWGDGTKNSYTLTSSDQNIYHTFSSGTYNIKIDKPLRITKWFMSGNGGSWSFDTKYLKNLTYLYLENIVGGQITVNTANITSLTYLYLNNLNTGTISITVNTANITSLTNLALYNLNTGTISITVNTANIPSLTYLYLYNLNTGTISITVNTANIPSLTLLSLLNLYTGTRNITANPADITGNITYYRFYIGTGATVDLSYTTKTWANNQNRVSGVVSTGGLTSGELDQLLIDLANVTTWTGEKIVDFTGAGNQARTSASDTAVTTLQGKGVTVTTN